MNRIIFGCALGLAAWCLSAPAQIKAGEPAGQLLLIDQYEHPFQLSDLHGSVVVLFVGDRTGSTFTDVWGRAVLARYKTQDYPQLKRVFVANLASVPGFMHGFVKRKILGKDPAHPGSPVLLDWQGAVAHNYGFRDNVANVYVIDRDGIMRYKGSGKGTNSDLDPLFHILDTLLGYQAP